MLVLKSLIIKLFLFILICLPPIDASVKVNLSHSVQRLANGNTIITDGGRQNPTDSKIIEVDSRGSLVWTYINGDLRWAHSAEKLSNGNILISDTQNDRVIEVDVDGNIVWSYATGLDYANDADRLSNGNTLITDRNHNRVIEVDSVGNIVWSYTNLIRPHNGDRLTNGNTIICDSERDKVIEVDSSGNVVWSYAITLNWPRDADRLANGNTLITDTKHGRIIEVTQGGSLVWSYGGLDTPYDADRLANGHTLISYGKPTNGTVIEVDSGGSVVWRYPGTKATIVDTIWIYNPASGCTLYVHLHRPEDASPSNPFPGVIIIPGGNGTGGICDTTGLADRIADDGFIFVHFDPDARGLSTNHGSITTEDYCGYKQQDGLWEVAKYLRSYPYVDTLSIGLFSQSYGITMASGELSRHRDDPYIKFLLDWEGPSDRYQTCQDSGGHVPVPPDSELFWIEREAARFMKSVDVSYLRMQTEVDHNPRIIDNRHAIALIDSGTAIEHGGKGICPWTRVNDSLMNPPNKIYTINNPPIWIAESAEVFNEVRYLLYLHELVGKTQPKISEQKGKKITPPILMPTIIKNSDKVRFLINQKSRISIRIYDSTGRLIDDVYTGVLDKGLHYMPISIRNSGVYFVVVSDEIQIYHQKFILIN